jgi:hypothetical protein
MREIADLTDKAYIHFMKNLFFILTALVLTLTSTGCDGFKSTRFISNGGLGTPDPGPGPGPGPGPSPLDCRGLPEKCGDSVELSWTKPTHNTDGTPLVNLAGFKIFMGGTSRNYSTVIEYNNLTRDIYDLTSLPAGTYYFAMKSVNSENVESNYTGEVAICLRTCPGANVVRTAEITEYPNEYVLTISSGTAN